MEPQRRIGFAFASTLLLGTVLFETGCSNPAPLPQESNSKASTVAASTASATSDYSYIPGPTNDSTFNPNPTAPLSCTLSVNQTTSTGASSGQNSFLFTVKTNQSPNSTFAIQTVTTTTAMNYNLSSDGMSLVGTFPSSAAVQQNIEVVIIAAQSSSLAAPSGTPVNAKCSTTLTLVPLTGLNNSNNLPSFNSGCNSNVAAQAASLVVSYYRSILGSTPTSEQIQTQTNQLISFVQNGGSPQLALAAIARSIIASDANRTQKVAGYYNHFLRRAPDAAGLANWVARLKAGDNYSAIISGMVGSPEYASLNGSTANGFITALYRDILGRTPDASGLTYWVSTAQSTSHTSIALAFLNSDEFYANYINYLQSKLGMNVNPALTSRLILQMRSGTSMEEIFIVLLTSEQYISAKTSILCPIGSTASDDFGW